MPAAGLHSPCIMHLNAQGGAAFAFKCNPGSRITPHSVASRSDRPIRSSMPTQLPMPSPGKFVQDKMTVEVIKRYPGPTQVTRSVWLYVPGKEFPNRTPAEQSEFYKGTAVESKDKHKFPHHLKAWGAEHTGPGIRFLCEFDALDDPDHRGFALQSLS